MPQMMPMNWMLLPLSFLLVFLFSFAYLYNTKINLNLSALTTVSGESSLNWPW